LYAAPSVVPIVIRHSPEQQLRLDCWHAFAAAPSVKKKKKKKKKKKHHHHHPLTHHKSSLLKSFLAACVESNHVDEWAIEQTM
jgi:hypothetical protein